VPVIASRPGPLELVLVRHGESLGNVANRDALEQRAPRVDIPVRDADVELSATGEHQADALAGHLVGLADDERPTCVLSSPYRRARDTAAHVMARWPQAPRPLLDERLRERELGLFDGLTGVGIRGDHPEEAARREQVGKFYYRPPYGESWCDVALRVRSFLADARFDHDGARLWVFTHQAVIMAFRVALEGLSEEQVLDLDDREPLANCSMTTYRAGDDGRLRLVQAGSTVAVEGSSAPVTREEERLDAATGDGSGSGSDTGSDTSTGAGRATGENAPGAARTAGAGRSS